ncbi:hypothetical protein [Streptomyces decoyicus]|uniref:hypothetical protein n=1 Tax=Streptomyces decoyicus TaxID=249567 RepID=UPI0033A4A1B3
MNTRAWIVFLDESGVILLPQIRRTYAPRGRTPLLRHRLNWKRASMAGALGYHSTDPDRGARLCFHLKPSSYIRVLAGGTRDYRGLPRSGSSDRCVVPGAQHLPDMFLDYRAPTSTVVRPRSEQ